MPFEITVKTEPVGRDELQPEHIGSALVDSINDLAERARLHVVEAMPAHIDKPTPYTLRGIGVRRAKGHRRHTGLAEADVLSHQARYLRLQILGGVQVA
ncbi:hypothetical protein HCU64_09860 [Methylobacterium sp. C25]|uniref:hypothetical protein n=1 Tax=Methylobacterium sp. C25 TaxID=2721622 RepID=UPI001F290BD7|nr:hypothetical protein [Methylobacterium sp. C25]MCE4224056.1 hypothetical protein [Methylobacterium sp. C25]